MKKRLLTTVIAGAAITLIAGCSSSPTDGEALVAGSSGGFDLCSLLNVDEMAKDGYLESDLHVTVTKRIESSSYHDGGMAACMYGTYKAAGVTLAVPVKAAPEVADLIGGTKYNKEIKEIKVAGATKAYVEDEGALGIDLVVQHSSTQFLLHWESLSYGALPVSVEQVKSLAEKIIKGLPERLDVADRDLPAACDGLEAKAEAVVGRITMARGSADVDNLYCDFAGENGILLASSRWEEPFFLKSQTDSARKYESEYKADIDLGPDVAIQATKIAGLESQGVVADCCTFAVKVDPADDFSESDKDKNKVTAAEREFLIGFTDASVEWEKARK